MNENAGLNSTLWKNDLYTTKEFDFIISNKITEYDMKDAGFNLIIYYHLLSDDKIKYLSGLEKMERKIQIGKIERSNRDFAKKLTESFGLMRKEFFKANQLENTDIVSVKKDAIFVVGKTCQQVTYGNVVFKDKHVYSSFHKLGGLEFYYTSGNNEIDVKGIDDKNLPRNKVFLDLLKLIFKKLEYYDNEEFTRFMKKLIYDYKHCNLSYEYYRELNRTGCFRILSNKNEQLNYFVEHMPADHSLDDQLDIAYNYMAYLLPIVQRHYFPAKIK